MKFSVVCVFFLSVLFCDVSNCKSFITSYKGMDTLLRRIGANEEYVQKFNQDFDRLNKLYCNPKEKNEKKLKSVQNCFEVDFIYHPIYQKCREQAYATLSPIKIRNMECGAPKRDQRQLLAKLNNCVQKELKDGNKSNNRRSSHESTVEPSLSTQNMKEILEKMTRSIDSFRDCYEKALS